MDYYWRIYGVMVFCFLVWIIYTSTSPKEASQAAPSYTLRSIEYPKQQAICYIMDDRLGRQHLSCIPAPHLNTQPNPDQIP